MLLAVLFWDENLMLSPGADEALAALRYWGVPFAARGTRDGDLIRKNVPSGSLWTVCDTLEGAVSAQGCGSPVVFVGSNHQFNPLPDDHVIASLHGFEDAVRPIYARTALRLRDVIASEFETP